MGGCHPGHPGYTPGYTPGHPCTGLSTATRRARSPCLVQTSGIPGLMLGEIGGFRALSPVVKTVNNGCFLRNPTKSSRLLTFLEAAALNSLIS